jgi:hypothetical protein
MSSENENAGFINKMKENFVDTYGNLKAGANKTLDNLKSSAQNIKERVIPSDNSGSGSPNMQSKDESKMEHAPVAEHGQDAYDKTAPLVNDLISSEESKCNVHYEPAVPHSSNLGASPTHKQWKPHFHAKEHHQDAYDKNASLSQNLWDQDAKSIRKAPR